MFHSLIIIHQVAIIPYGSVVNSTPPRFVNSKLVFYQPVGICTKFLFIYLRVAMETAGTPGLEFSLPYRVSFFSRMYYTTGVKREARGRFEITITITS